MVLIKTITPFLYVVIELAITIKATQPNSTPMLIKLSKKPFKNKLTPRLIYKTKKIVALVILGFGVLLLVQGFFPKEKELLKEKIEQINPLD